MVLLSEDFPDKQVFIFPVAHFRLVTSAGLELFAVGVGDGASQAGISDRTSQGSSRKFSCIVEVEKGRETAASAALHSERCHQSGLSSSCASGPLQVPEAAETPIKGSQANQPWSPNLSWGAPSLKHKHPQSSTRLYCSHNSFLRVLFLKSSIPCLGSAGMAPGIPGCFGLILRLVFPCQAVEQSDYRGAVECLVMRGSVSCLRTNGKNGKLGAPS